LAVLVTLAAGPFEVAPQAHGQVLAGDPTGVFAVEMWLRDCPDGCRGAAGRFVLWRAGADWRFHKAPALPGGEVFSTPTPPMISPDGRWIAYARAERWPYGSRTLVIRAFDASTGRVTGPPLPLPAVHDDWGETALVCWSPDSRSLALIGHVGRQRGLWIAGRDGSGLRRIVSGSVVDVSGDVDYQEWPAWASTGRIAFTGSPPGRSRDALYTVEADGSNLTRITRLGVLSAQAPAWSPDGRMLAFGRSLRDETVVKIVDLVTARTRTVHNAYSAAFAPDGLRAAYERPAGISIAPLAANGPSRRLRPDVFISGPLQWVALP
jgi:hypothetical protein